MAYTDRSRCGMSCTEVDRDPIYHQVTSPPPYLPRYPSPQIEAHRLLPYPPGFGEFRKCTSHNLCDDKSWCFGASSQVVMEKDFFLRKPQIIVSFFLY